MLKQQNYCDLVSYVEDKADIRECSHNLPQDLRESLIWRLLNNRNSRLICSRINSLPNVLNGSLLKMCLSCFCCDNNKHGRQGTHVIIIKLNGFTCKFGNKLNSFNKLHSSNSCNLSNSFNLFPNCTENHLIWCKYCPRQKSIARVRRGQYALLRAIFQVI